LREEYQVVVTHAADQIHGVRAESYDRREIGWSIRERRRGIERVRKERITPGILVPPEHAVEIVPFVLADPQAGHIVRVAAVSGVGKNEAVEKESVVVERLHFESRSQQPRAGAKVYKGVVSGFVAGKIGEPSSKFKRLLDEVVTRLDAIEFRVFRRLSSCQLRAEE